MTLSPLVLSVRFVAVDFASPVPKKAFPLFSDPRISLNCSAQELKSPSVKMISEYRIVVFNAIINLVIVLNNLILKIQVLSKEIKSLIEIRAIRTMRLIR